MIILENKFTMTILFLSYFATIKFICVNIRKIYTSTYPVITTTTIVTYRGLQIFVFIYFSTHVDDYILLFCFTKKINQTARGATANIILILCINFL